MKPFHGMTANLCAKSATGRYARRTVSRCGEFYGVGVAIEVGEDCEGTLKPLPSWWAPNDTPASAQMTESPINTNTRMAK